VFLLPKAAYPAQTAAELAAQLARKLVNELVAQCSDAMPCGKRQRGWPHDAAVFRGRFRQEPVYVLCRLPAVAQLATRAAPAVFSPFGQNGHLAALGQPGPEQACPNEVR